MFWYNFGCDLLRWLLLIDGVGEFSVCLTLLTGVGLGVFGYCVVLCFAYCLLLTVVFAVYC